MTIRIIFGYTLRTTDSQLGDLDLTCDLPQYKIELCLLIDVLAFLISTVRNRHSPTKTTLQMLYCAGDIEEAASGESSEDADQLAEDNLPEASDSGAEGDEDDDVSTSTSDTRALFSHANQFLTGGLRPTAT